MQKLVWNCIYLIENKLKMKFVTEVLILTVIRVSLDPFSRQSVSAVYCHLLGEIDPDSMSHSNVYWTQVVVFWDNTKIIAQVVTQITIRTSNNNTYNYKIWIQIALTAHHVSANNQRSCSLTVH